MNYYTEQRGFIALMSTIVISAIVLALMMSTGLASFYARFDALGSENKREAFALAESCVNVGLLALATSSDAAHYAPNNQIVSVGTDAWGNPLTCTIKNILYNGSDATVDTYASSDNSFDNVSATVSLVPSIRIISWKELP